MLVHRRKTSMQRQPMEASRPTSAATMVPLIVAILVMRADQTAAFSSISSSARVFASTGMLQQPRILTLTPAQQRRIRSQRQRQQQHCLQQHQHRQPRGQSGSELAMMPDPHDAAMWIGGASEFVSKAFEMNPFSSMGFELPFQDMGSDLQKSLDLSSAFNQGRSISAEDTLMVMESLGQDFLTFLAASVVVTTISNAVGITPILGYLLAGAILGPHGADFFSNAQTGVKLGDFGILFLLFSEGLEVTSQRLRKLANYLPLGGAQISLTTGILTACLLLSSHLVPLTSPLMNIDDPMQAFILAVTGALSTSAFIFPVLKEKGWEEEQSGEAATTILLLQDLLVAPLLVVLPYLASDGPTDFSAIGFLTAKATIGFGLVIALGSYVVQQLFRVVAQTRSSETFVALCLLVSVGMGEIATALGLTDTAGAFAAGVLLANTNYRAQIQADILPFKGILLGIFFMDAGSNFDTGLVLNEWETVLTGAISLVAAKAATMALATNIPEQFERNKLSKADAIRVSILLAGGGEFAFLVLALAQKIDVLPKELIGLLTAIVLVTMGVTPILGDLAANLSEPFVSDPLGNVNGKSKQTDMSTTLPEDAIVICGHGESGRAVLRVLGEDLTNEQEVNGDPPSIVAFSRNPGLADCFLIPGNGTLVMYGDGSNPEVIKSSGIVAPRAIFVTYVDHTRVESATARLRSAFPKTPIYCRAANRREARNLKLAGSSITVVECDELARSVPQLMKGTYGPLEDSDFDITEDDRLAASSAANIPLPVVDSLFELYDSLDMCASGLLGRDDIIELFRKTKDGFVASDGEIQAMEQWLASTPSAHMDPLDKVEFCRLYARAPDFVKDSFGRIRDVEQGSLRY